METLPRQPAEEKQGRPTMLLRKRKRLENPGVYENPCGDLMLLALAHSFFILFILFVEDVGAHLLR